MITGYTVAWCRKTAGRTVRVSFGPEQKPEAKLFFNTLERKMVTGEWVLLRARSSGESLFARRGLGVLQPLPVQYIR